MEWPGPPVPFPPELIPHKNAVQNYVNARIRQFAIVFASRVNVTMPPERLDLFIHEVSAALSAQPDHAPAITENLRLVLRHDCQSTGCGDSSCTLCQYNPSRLCKRNLKNKYLIDDHLRAKCGAALRVEVVDEGGRCMEEGLPMGVQLEVHVLNGEKYKEVCPDNTLLSHQQLKLCIIQPANNKALLKREGGSGDELRVFLQLERGLAPLSELQVTTSSEALLSGKAPTFRLLVWAVDMRNNEPAPNITYVVSESFVVATKRVKHAIKSDIPSISDHISKLVHIGKASVDKLQDLRKAGKEEGFEVTVPDHLNKIEQVGQFKDLLDHADHNSDLKNKVRHLLKLSPEKWDEVVSHAQGAVMPDFRPRVWWYTPARVGLMYGCKNGAVNMEQPTAFVKMGREGTNEGDQVTSIHQLDPALFNAVPKLKAQAMAAWYAPHHPGWTIYHHLRESDPIALQGGPVQGLGFDPGMPLSAAYLTALHAHTPSPPPQMPSISPFARPVPQLQQLQQQQQLPAPPNLAVAAISQLAGSSRARPVDDEGQGGGGGRRRTDVNGNYVVPEDASQGPPASTALPSKSPFAIPNLMTNISNDFPNIAHLNTPGSRMMGGDSLQLMGMDSNALLQAGLGSLDLLKGDGTGSLQITPSLFKGLAGLAPGDSSTGPPDWQALLSGQQQQHSTQPSRLNHTSTAQQAADAPGAGGSAQQAGQQQAASTAQQRDEQGEVDGGARAQGGDGGNGGGGGGAGAPGDQVVMGRDLQLGTSLDLDRLNSGALEGM